MGILIRRAKLVEAMHEIISCLNDEAAYMDWVYLVPDCPCDDDFSYIAEDDDLFAESCELFRELIANYGGSGFYCSGDKRSY